MRSYLNNTSFIALTKRNIGMLTSTQ